MAAPWTNRDQTVFAPLNDYTATVIGMVRDDVDFHTSLSADIIYIGQRRRRRRYSATSNAHYENAGDQQRRTCAPCCSRPRSRRCNGMPPAATAGFITSRAASEAFFIDGTNRAMFRFTLMNHMCRDMEQVHDTSRAAGSHPPGREPQPRRRQPHLPEQLHRLPQRHGSDGAGVRVLRLRRDAGPAGLHAGPGAAEVLHQRRQLRAGLRHAGRRLGEPLAPPGQNTLLGWVGPTLPGSGNGAKSMGEELANSDAFAQCQVEKVFRTVCFRAPGDAADRAPGQPA